MATFMYFCTKISFWISDPSTRAYIDLSPLKKVIKTPYDYLYKLTKSSGLTVTLFWWWFLLATYWHQWGYLPSQDSPTNTIVITYYTLCIYMLYMLSYALNKIQCSWHYKLTSESCSLCSLSVSIGSILASCNKKNIIIIGVFATVQTWHLQTHVSTNRIVLVSIVWYRNLISMILKTNSERTHFTSKQANFRTAHAARSDNHRVIFINSLLSGLYFTNILISYTKGLDLWMTSGGMMGVRELWCWSVQN